MQNLMEKIICLLVSLQNETSNKVVIKDYNPKCLNDYATHVSMFVFRWFTLL